VLACQRASLRQRSPLLGTSFSDDHAAQVSRLCREAVLVFDGDAPPGAVRASYEATQKGARRRLKTMVDARCRQGGIPTAWCKRAC